MDHKGVAELSECESVVADRFVGVGGHFTASSHHEVIELNILQVVELVESI
jgi:hypothetical protein